MVAVISSYSKEHDAVLVNIYAESDADHAQLKAIAVKHDATNYLVPETVARTLPLRDPYVRIANDLSLGGWR